MEHMSIAMRHLRNLYTLNLIVFTIAQLICCQHELNRGEGAQLGLDLMSTNGLIKCHMHCYWNKAIYTLLIAIWYLLNQYASNSTEQICPNLI